MHCLEMLGCNEIYFSRENECIRINHDAATFENDLTSNQEEADTKAILLSKHAFDRSPEETINVRYPCGKIDINITMICIFMDCPCPEHFYLDIGSGKNRKGLCPDEIDLEPEVKQSLIGYPAFTGNAYVS